MKSHRWVLLAVFFALVAIFVFRPTMPKKKVTEEKVLINGTLHAEGVNLNARLQERVGSEEVVRVR